MTNQSLIFEKLTKNSFNHYSSGKYNTVQLLEPQYSSTG